MAAAASAAVRVASGKRRTRAVSSSRPSSRRASAKRGWAPESEGVMPGRLAAGYKRHDRIHRGLPSPFHCHLPVVQDAAMTSSPAVRPYRPQDRDAVEDICVRTAHAGRDSRPHYKDPGVFPAAFAAPYVHLEPELAFVLDDGAGQAVGYSVGTPGTPRFVENYPAKWLPPGADRYPEPRHQPRSPHGGTGPPPHRPPRTL